MSRDFNKYFFDCVRYTLEEPSYEDYANREPEEDGSQQLEPDLKQ